MSRLIPYLGTVAALAVFLFIMAISDTVTVEQQDPSISTTIPAVIQDAFPIDLVPESPPAINYPTAPSTPPISPTREPVAPEALLPSPIQPIFSPLPPPIPTNAMFDASALALRTALVNIICDVPTGSNLRSISGSGIFIDSKGIILTNAHIAQYFLLANRGVSCTIRTGSPATDRYKAALVFISSAWLRANPTTLTQKLPSGTGEYDFALLAVTKSATSAALPPSFPFVPPATAPPASGAAVVIASYGSQFLESSQVRFSLFPTIVFGSVKDVFTFKTNTIDVLGLGGSAAAQGGSSGGGVANAEGELIGTITTSTVSGATDTRSLTAITASYIRAEYANETGQPLDLLLAESPATSITNFAPQIPALEAIITAHFP